jgi:hypothetical protein
MKEPRNPFKIRASEHIESDETFVRLFSPGVLEMLNTEDLWDKPKIIRSAPGAGKTTLLRLFTARSMLTIYSLRKMEYCAELFQNLKAFGVVNDNGPAVLGVLLSCSRNYATLEDLDVDPGKRRRLLLSLLNARIVLAALQGILTLKGLKYPLDLEQIEVCPSQDLSSLHGLVLPCSGTMLYQWAQSLEKAVCDALDSFAPLTDSSLPGHDSLVAAQLITADSIKHEGSSVVDRVLLMFDDLHRLTQEQRRFLLDDVVNARLPVSMWIAERLEALDVDEILAAGALPGRDYTDEITIEEYWRRTRPKAFSQLVMNIADRRAKDARDVEIGSFAGCLPDSLDGRDWQDRFQNAGQRVAERTREKAKGKQRYSRWVADREGLSDHTPREIALSWRSLEILIEREERKVQKSIDFPMKLEELQKRDDSDVRAAAELFLCKEFDIPYYFGIDRLANLSSSNIEQFLALAGEMFEQSASAYLLKRSSDIAPGLQEQILKRAVKKSWEKLPEWIPQGHDVQKFIKSIGRFSNWATHQPNAPYSPGVTGVAISMSDRRKLADAKVTQKIPELARLASVIRTCIAHNLLKVTLDYKCKGQNWMILYLNRMFCIHFDLPLQYGGWREKKLTDLVGWLQKDFKPPKAQLELFE